MTIASWWLDEISAMASRFFLWPRHHGKLEILHVFNAVKSQRVDDFEIEPARGFARAVNPPIVIDALDLFHGKAAVGKQGADAFPREETQVRPVQSAAVAVAPFAANDDLPLRLEVPDVGNGGDDRAAGLEQRMCQLERCRRVEQMFEHVVENDR